MRARVARCESLEDISKVECTAIRRSLQRLHEKTVKGWLVFIVGMRYGIGLPCGLLGSMFRSNLPQRVERCHLVIEVVSLSGDGSQSFQIVQSSIMLCHPGRVDRRFGSSTGLTTARKVCAPRRQSRVSSPWPCHRPPASSAQNRCRRSPRSNPIVTRFSCSFIDAEHTRARNAQAPAAFSSNLVRPFRVVFVRKLHMRQ
jgi:hypothetical protein